VGESKRIIDFKIFTKLKKRKINTPRLAQDYYFFNKVEDSRRGMGCLWASLSVALGELDRE
jgi:hypothetical protein